MRIDYTLRNFPATGALKNQCGLPFACVVQPFAQPKQQLSPGAARTEDVSRCGKCYGYVNKHCSFQAEGWTCSLCGYFNEFKGFQGSRYAKNRSELPELQGDLYEVECPLDGDGESTTQDGGGEEKKYDEEVRPVYVTLVDLSCNEEVLELVKSALAAALEALPPAALFGIVTFSNKIGLYDVQGKLPVLHSLPLVDNGKGSPTPLELQDALPLEALLAPVATCKEAIAAAIESLQPSWTSGDSPSLQEGRSPPKATRGFGNALQAVLRYLGSTKQAPPEANGTKSPTTEGASAPPKCAGARLLVFLAGPANHGRGAVVEPAEEAAERAPILTASGGVGAAGHGFPGSSHRPSPSHQPTSLAQPDSNFRRAEGARAFYEEAAAAATTLRVCVDIFAVSPVFCGLDAIEPLAGSSGGCMFLYPSPEKARLPQDVYRRLASPLACNGLLRVRTSVGFRPKAGYGQLAPDEVYEDLMHVAACGPSASFAFDLEHEGTASLSPDMGDRPLLQIAFRYDSFGPASPGASQKQPHANGGSKQPSRHVLRRRLRVLTVAASVGRTSGEVYSGVDLDSVLVMLMHKIGRAAAAQGLQEARKLLRDWLVLFLSKYNRHLAASSAPPPLTAEQVDMALARSGGLQPLPGLVYALLRSPLLSTQPPPHADSRAAADHLWGALPPDQLRCAVYPVLASYSDPDTVAKAAHALSRSALISAAAPMFLLDSFSELFVYYVVGCPPHIPFPPPPQSAMRRRISAARACRLPTPALQLLRGGVDDVRPVLDCLLEEPEPGNGGLQGLPDYLERLRESVWDHMIATSRQ